MPVWLVLLSEVKKPAATSPAGVARRSMTGWSAPGFHAVGDPVRASSAAMCFRGALAIEVKSPPA